YMHLVGRLMYLVVTCPDLSYSLHVLFQFMDNPFSLVTIPLFELYHSNNIISFHLLLVLHFPIQKSMGIWLSDSFILSSLIRTCLIEFMFYL
ncbi:Unknown protein, partial [Striga hermonthica]